MILRRYIGGSVLAGFLTSLLVVTVVMSTGVVFRLMDLIARGVPWTSVAWIYLCGIPSSLTLSIPVSVLMSCLLVFGRMSSDGEVAAMKASGVNMWQIAVGPLLLSIPLAVGCLYINNTAAPESLYLQRILVRDLGADNPVQMLDEGRFIQEFDGLTIYIGARKGSRLRDVRIYDLRDPEVRREIWARSGVVGTNAGGGLVIEMFNVRVDPLHPGMPGPGFCDAWTVRIGGDAPALEKTKRQVYMTGAEMKDMAARAPELVPGLAEKDYRRLRMSIAVERNKRIVLAMACFAFVLLGVPLGVQSHRKESSIGVAIGLFLVLNFYVFILIAESMNKVLFLRPDLIVWAPLVASTLIGWRLMHRIR
ncbi:MAG: YjgP/YjgQ family permease [Lentisphaerae bacterium]|nr:YjgP/YjgQ family permease [Lentisphaerota bacterium]